MRVALKLIAVFVLAILLITVALAYLTMQRTYQLAEKRQKEYAELFVDELYRDLFREWREGGIEALEAYIQSRARDPFVQSRWVWFEEGGDSPEGDHNQPQAGSRAQQVLETEDQMLSVVTRSDQGIRQLHTYCALDIDSDRKGGIEFTSSLASVDQEAGQTIFRTILMISVIALLSIGVVLLASVRIVARPLQLLTRKTVQIGGGDFGVPIKLSGQDELNQLADSINEMCVRLTHQQQKLTDEMSQRRETESQLRHADRLKTVGRLAAGIAHEIGTPLGVISGRAAMIFERKLDETKQLDSARAIKKEADKITATIRKLLNFARPSAFQSMDFELIQRVRDTVALVSTLASEQNHQIVLEENAVEIEIHGDPNQIEQVVTNLLVNAIQASPPEGEIRVVIDRVFAVHPESSGPTSKKIMYATLEVSDHGLGIEKENLKHIFEPFFTTKDVGKGTGLGLSIAYGIVHEHRGWIEVESEIGEGSCFRVYLPVLQREETSE